MALNNKNTFLSLVVVISTLSYTSMRSMFMWNAIKNLWKIPKHVEMSIWEAARRCDLKYIQQLFNANKGITADVKDDHGHTPLHWATSNGHLEIVRYLIKKGATVDIKDDCGDTALHVAAANNYPEIVKHLIKKGALVGLQNKDGKTPLHWVASNRGNLETVKFLCGVFNFKTVIEGYNWQQAQKLLQFLSIKDAWGNLALERAKKENHPEVVNYLTNIKKEAERVESPLLRTLVREQKIDTIVLFRKESRKEL